MTALEGRPRDWRTHLAEYLKRSMVAALIGCFVALLLHCLHGTLPVLQLERAGSDAAMRYYAWQLTKRENNARRRVVIVTLGRVEGEGVLSEQSNGTVEGLTALLQKVRQSGAAAVLLDVQIEDTVRSNYLVALEKELRQKRGGNVIAVPLHVAPFREQKGGSYFRDDWQAQSDVFPSLHEQHDFEYIQWVVPAIEADSDGIIRRIAPWACVLVADGAWTTYPTLAFSVAPQRIPEGAFKTDCPNPKLKRPTILYSSRGTSIGALIPVLRGAQVMSNDPTAAKQLQGAVVLIGQLSWEDTHMTPLGPMPGVLVQANAVSTALENFPSYQPSEMSKLLSETLEIISVALFLGVFPLIQFAILWPPFAFLRWMRHQFGAATEVKIPEVQWTLTHFDSRNPSCSVVARAFVDFFAGMIAIALLGSAVWALLGGTLLDFAARQLRYGVVVGTFVPLLAVALETFVDISEYFVRFANVLVEFIASRLRCLLISFGQLLSSKGR
jgi:CHASE2 domain